MDSLASITLIIPSFNRAELIVETIRSALNQTRSFAEIIVVDDASTDSTLQVLKQFNEKITVIASKKVGVQAARNKGVMAASTPYITLCDSDDLLEPQYVEILENWLDRSPDCDSVYSNFVTFRKDVTGSHKFSDAPPSFFEGATADGIFLSRIPNLYEKTAGFQPLFSSGVTIKKTFYQKIGGYNPIFNGIGAEDWEYTLRAIETGKTTVCMRPLVRIRRHTGNDSADTVRQLLGEVVVLEHAISYHKSGALHKKSFLEQIDLRRIQAFELAFGTKRFDIAKEILPKIKRRPVNLKFCIKSLIISGLSMKQKLGLLRHKDEIHKPAS